MQPYSRYIEFERSFDIGTGKMAVAIVLGRVYSYQKHIHLKTEDDAGTVTDATIADALRKLADNISPQK